MEINTDLISVIVPVYNGEVFLADAIGSILKQGCYPLEIIVVDDGSTDGTAAVVRRFSETTRYIYQNNSGPPSARNTGLKAAGGNLIAFLDADDLWPDGTLKFQLSLMAQHPNADIVIGLKRFENLGNYRKTADTDIASSKTMLSLNLASALFKRHVFDAIGLFDSSLRHCDDWDWFMRAREQGIALFLHNRTTLIQRRHEHNLTNNVKEGNEFVLKMLKKSIDRRNSSSGGDAQSLASLLIYEKQTEGE